MGWLKWGRGSGSFILMMLVLWKTWIRWMSSRQVVDQQWSSLHLLLRKLFILHPAQETSGKIFSLKMGQITYFPSFSWTTFLTKIRMKFLHYYEQKRPPNSRFSRRQENLSARWSAFGRRKSPAKSGVSLRLLEKNKSIYNFHNPKVMWFKSHLRNQRSP